MTVYYLSVDGYQLQHIMFESEKAAQEYAEKEKFDDYFIIEKKVYSR